MGTTRSRLPGQRYALIDYQALGDLLNFRSMDDLAKAYRGWVEESLHKTGCFRDEKWTGSVAVGSEAFVMATKEKLGFKAKGREVVGRDGSFELKEEQLPYRGILRHENVILKPSESDISGRICVLYQHSSLARPAGSGTRWARFRVSTPTVSGITAISAFPVPAA